MLYRHTLKKTRKREREREKRKEKRTLKLINENHPIDLLFYTRRGIGSIEQEVSINNRNQ